MPFERVKPVVRPAEVELPCTLAHGAGAIEVHVVQSLGFVGHERVRVHGEPATCGQQQAGMIGRLHEQALGELQAERQRAADEFDVVVGLVDGVARREGVADHVDGVGPEGAGGGGCEH